MLLTFVLWGSPQRPDQPPLVTLEAWTETTRIVGQAYCRRELSADYFRETLAQARIEIERLRRDLESAHYDRFAADARDTILAIDRIDGRVLANDYNRACALLDELNAPLVASR